MHMSFKIDLKNLELSFTTCQCPQCPILEKMTRSHQIDLTPWIQTLVVSLDESVEYDQGDVT